MLCVYAVFALPCYRLFVFFFFSSRRRHTRYIGDWSSDVCSSDLQRQRRRHRAGPLVDGDVGAGDEREGARDHLSAVARSEERRVGKEGRSRWGRAAEKEKIRRQGRRGGRSKNPRKARAGRAEYQR